jgi:hypothetical protein
MRAGFLAPRREMARNEIGKEGGREEIVTADP